MDIERKYGTGTFHFKNHSLIKEIILGCIGKRDVVKQFRALFIHLYVTTGNVLLFGVEPSNK